MQLILKIRKPALFGDSNQNESFRCKILYLDKYNQVKGWIVGEIEDKWTKSCESLKKRCLYYPKSKSIILLE